MDTNQIAPVNIFTYNRYYGDAPNMDITGLPPSVAMGKFPTSIPDEISTDYGITLMHSGNLNYATQSVETGTNGNGASVSGKITNPDAPPMWNTIAAALFGKK